MQCSGGFRLSRVDADHDQGITQSELLDHVLKNVAQHLKEAKDRNSQLFVLIVSDLNGKGTM